jgi:hypothetical protein
VEGAEHPSPFACVLGLAVAWRAQESRGRQVLSEAKRAVRDRATKPVRRIVRRACEPSDLQLQGLPLEKEENNTLASGE